MAFGNLLQKLWWSVFGTDECGKLFLFLLFLHLNYLRAFFSGDELEFSWKYLISEN